MGMVLEMRTLSDGNIGEVLNDPPLIWKVLAPDDPEAYERARADRRGFWARLFRTRHAPAVPQKELAISAGEGDEADLDKAWHGIHYMLTQSARDGEEPLNFLVAGGAQVGDLEVGYGPARAFLSEQVRSLHAALEPLDAEALKARFDPTDMMKQEIYPGIWDRDPGEDDSFAYCVEYFEVLKKFIAAAARDRLGVIVFLT